RAGSSIAGGGATLTEPKRKKSIAPMTAKVARAGTNFANERTDVGMRASSRHPWSNRRAMRRQRKSGIQRPIQGRASVADRGLQRCGLLHAASSAELQRLRPGRLVRK